MKENNTTFHKQISKLFPYGSHKVLAIDLKIKDSDLSTMLKVHDKLFKKLKLVAITEEDYKDMKELNRLLINELAG